MLPTFIIIGAMKAGTTSLHRYLDLHPAIFMAKEKELRFFSVEENFEKGPAWYASHFDVGEAICGEASGSYTKYPFFDGVPQRMYSVLPEVKLIYLLRDPVERMISHYLHNYAHGRENGPISDALLDRENRHYVACSMYYMQIEQYLQYYPPESLLILTAEALKTQRAATLKKVYLFLGVDDSFYSPEYSIIHHQTDQKRRRSKFNSMLAKLAAAQKLKPFVPHSLVEGFKNLTDRRVERPILDADLVEVLNDWLKEDIASLKHFTQYEFTEWSS